MVKPTFDSFKASILDRYLLGDKILDLGCANNLYSHKSTISIDYNFSLLSEKFNSVQANALHIPLKPKQIDTTIAFDILEHLPENSLEEIIRVTRKRIIISVPHTTDKSLSSHFVLYGHHQDNTHLRTYTEKDLKALCKKHHIKIVFLTPSHPLNTQSLFLQLFSGPPLFKKLTRKLVFLFFKPLVFNTNLILVADINPR